MTKTKHTVKRTVSVWLSFLIVLSTMIGLSTQTVGASNTSSTLVFTGEGITFSNDINFTRVNIDGVSSGFHASWGNNTVDVQKVNDQYAYCIEPGINASYGDSLSENSMTFNSLDRYLQEAIGMVLTYGFPNNVSLVGTNAEKYSATQVIMWELLCGYRGYTKESGYICSDTRFYNGLSYNSNFKTNYKIISDLMAKHWKIPSFSAPFSNKAVTYNMNYNDTTDKYSVTLTDTNDMLDEFGFITSKANVSATRYGNQLLVKSTVDFSDEITFNATKHNSSLESQNLGTLSWSNGSKQDVVTAGASIDPPSAYFKVQIVNGSALQLRKTSDDGNVSDIYFLVSGSGVSGGTKLYCTDANGYINATDLPTGTELTVREIGYKNDDGTYSLPSYYDTPALQTVVLEPNKTAIVTFHNSRNDKKLNIKKTAEDGNVSNIAFEITDLTENRVLGIFTTDKNGNISIANDKLSYHTYSIKELGTLKNSAITGSQNAGDYKLSPAYAELPIKTVTIKPTGEVFTVSFHNTLVKGKIRVLKSVETFNATSSVGLSGFEFRVTGTAVNGQKYDKTFTTDANGYIEIPELLIGTYKVSEVENDKTVGYILPDTQTVDLTVDGAEVNFENKLMRGDLTVVKTFEGRTTPLANVPFHIVGTLTATGETYDLGTLYTNENGKIELANLPIGTYTVEELESELTSDYVLSKAQTVQVAYNQLAELKIQNDLKTGEVKIIKTSEDGIIEDVEFEVYVNGTLKGTYRTNAKGEISIKGLKYNDSVRVHEVPNERYQATKDITKTIKSKTTTFEFENKLKTRNIEIIKTSEDNIVAGIDFTVTVNDILLGTYTTDENGKISIEGLKYGDVVTVSEIESDRYNVLDSITKTLTNETTTFEFHNTLKTRYVRIVKTSEDGIIEGIDFDVTVNSKFLTKY